MSENVQFQTHLDGRPATAIDLAPLAFAGFAHFTAMQVRAGCVRGLDLHLARLRSASRVFFGSALPDDQVCAYLRSALADGPADLSLTATMFSRTGEFTPTGLANDPAVLVRTGPAATGPAGPLRLMAVAHQRLLPTIKHVGESAKTLYLRQAVHAGFDDSAFIDSEGRLSEATIWNLAFWDGEAVIWPEATMLPGITMAIVRRQLQRLGVPQRQQPITLEGLKGMAGAAVMNSWTPGVSVSRIGAQDLPMSSRFLDILHQAYREEPPENF
ncbi:aminotransferase class IV family protein [Phaeospirillum tilakii]|uniref:Aminotransferase class IV family protein n=1 Tax=Phaeospirillum tilakii TaxID=741673 RepID=A0ABW5C8I2_9PROT